MRKHCDFFCAGIWPFLLIPLLLLLPLLYFCWHPIEQLVAKNVSDTLNDTHSWANTETYNRGREVLLSGDAPNQSAVDDAIAMARQADGARSVTFVGDVLEAAAPAPVSLAAPSMNAALSDGKLVLSGTVDSQATINTLLAQANTQFGADNVINNLQIGDNIAGLTGFGAGTFGALTGLLGDGQLSLQDNSLTLSGEVRSLETKSKLGDIASLAFGGNFNNELSIVAPSCQVTIKGLLSESQVNFGSGSATIKASSSGLLQQIADAANKCADAKFEVSGHTDSTGSDETNKALSEQRAAAVVNYLASLGLNPDRFTTRGVGSSEPVASNDTSTGRAANRRIEFRVTN